jgi:hypothetical protein
MVINKVLEYSFLLPPHCLFNEAFSRAFFTPQSSITKIINNLALPSRVYHYYLSLASES